ncbi:MAG: hypothetical protein JWM33_2214 [Caulobacteraceae bacterium]|nr:hypothetical protein [Caulobacteraceae bacterium]
MRRPLPDPQEAAEILARKRTRPARRPAPPAGRSLAPLIKALETRFGQGPDALRARWKEIVGAPLARCTEPVKLIRSRTGGATLELRVDGPAAAIIQHQAPEILARISLVLGAGAVEKLRIVQGPVRPQPGLPQVSRVRRKPPLDAAQEAELAEGLADQPDSPLKAALTRLGREVMRHGPR